MGMQFIIQKSKAYLQRLLLYEPCYTVHYGNISIRKKNWWI